MTLILGAVGRDYAVIASDRLLTCKTGRNSYRAVEPGACKLVCVSGRSCIAYTGPAYLDGKRTDYWLVDALAKANATNLLTATDAIAAAATAAVQKYPVGVRHLTFAACGWEFFKDVPEPVLVVAIVSNHYLGRGKFSKKAKGYFGRTRRAFQGITSPFVFTAGQVVSPTEKRLIRRRVKSAEGEKQSDYLITKILMSEILRFSKKNQAVGERILAFGMNRRAAQGIMGKQDIAVFSGYSEDQPHFLYFDPRDRSGTQYGPHFVSGGSAAVDFKAGPAIHSG